MEIVTPELIEYHQAQEKIYSKLQEVRSKIISELKIRENSETLKEKKQLFTDIIQANNKGILAISSLQAIVAAKDERVDVIAKELYSEVKRNQTLQKQVNQLQHLCKVNGVNYEEAMFFNPDGI